MKNEVKYSVFSKKKKSSIIPKNRNFDTMILDDIYYQNKVEYNFDSLSNIKNLIIDHKIIKKITDKAVWRDPTQIYSSKAENIYYKNCANLGGITFPLNEIDDNLIVNWGWGKEAQSNIKTINIITKNDVIKFNMSDEYLRKVSFFVRTKEDKNILKLVIETRRYEKEYYIDEELGLDKEATKTINYTYTERDLINDVLDLSNISSYNNVNFQYLNIDTLIINKKDLDKIKNNNFINNHLFVKKIKVIDDNDMKLNPVIEIDFNNELYIYNHEYILNKDLNKLLLEIESKDIKVLDKKELLKDENAKDVEFIFDVCQLIIIKYKNNNYKIIDLDKEYIFDKLFTKFFLMYIDSSLEKYYIQSEKILDWINIFKSGEYENEDLEEIYSDYLIFKERIQKLLELGFSYKTLIYFYENRFDNMINTNSYNLISIKDISENEINNFNEIGKSYIKKKRLTKK